MVYKIRKWIQSPSKQYQQYPLLEVCAVPPLISASETSKTFPPCTVLHSSVLSCIKRGGWKRKKLENLQTHKEQSDNQTIRRFKDWDHSNPLITRGSWPINSTPFYSILWRWPVLKFHPWLLLCPSIFRLGLSRHCSVVAAPITESNVCVWDPW